MAKRRTRQSKPQPRAPAPLSEEEWSRAIQPLGLSPQQARIVCLILQGRKYKQIAIEMRLRPSTIRTYLDRIFAHLNVGDRVELVSYIFAACRDQQKRKVEPRMDTDEHRSMQ